MAVGWQHDAIKAGAPGLGPRWLLTVSAIMALTIETGAQAGEGDLRALYAVNQAGDTRGSIAVYDIDAGHRFIKTIQTVQGVHNVKGIAANAILGRLYV